MFDQKSPFQQIKVYNIKTLYNVYNGAPRRSTTGWRAVIGHVCFLSAFVCLNIPKVDFYHSNLPLQTW